MAQRKRYFTVEEANRLIPKLEEEVADLKVLRDRLASLGAQLSPLFEVIHHNGGHPKSLEFLQAVQAFRQAVDRIHGYGCYMKGIDNGLLDFPHLREGREVYLCWKSGEDEIRYWHELDNGYAGRQPLEE